VKAVYNNCFPNVQLLSRKGAEIRALRASIATTFSECPDRAVSEHGNDAADAA
jgi:hypothetical protein